MMEWLGEEKEKKVKMERAKEKEREKEEERRCRKVTEGWSGLRRTSGAREA